MLLLACRIAPARKYSVPMLKRADDRAPDDVHVGRVVAERADDREQRARDQLALGERDILLVDLVRQPGEALGQEFAQAEELQFLGGFLAAAQHAQVIELAADRRLAEILGVAQECEVALAQKRRQHAGNQQQQQPGREVDDG